MAQALAQAPVAEEELRARFRPRKVYDATPAPVPSEPPQLPEQVPQPAPQVAVQVPTTQQTAQQPPGTRGEAVSTVELTARLAHRISPESHLPVIRLVQELERAHRRLAALENCLRIARRVESGEPVAPGDALVYREVCGSRASAELEDAARELRELRDRLYSQLWALAEERGATEELRQLLEHLGVLT